MPTYLNYLQTLGVGMSAYQLSTGYLLKPDGQPTNYTDAPWESSFCTYTSGARPPLLGAGADILAWFQGQDQASHRDTETLGADRTVLAPSAPSAGG